MTGTITGYEVIENRNSSQKVLMLQVELSGPEDIQSVEWYNSGGVQSIPIVGSKVQILQNGRGWKVAVSANDGIDFDDTLSEGDKKIYGGSVDSTIIMRADGTIEINGNDDFAVSYNDLETAFNELKDNYNSLVNVLKSWTVVPSDGGAALKLAVTTLNPVSSADITASKVSEVKLP